MTAATIEAIVWDLDETLIHEESAVRDAFARAGEVAKARAGVQARDFA
jgi:FMN phosphatase YigB (HAD superfamily)